MHKRKVDDGHFNATRVKLEGTPFKTAAEMDKISQEIQLQVWKRLEYSRLFQKMTDKEDYRFIREEFENGLRCNYNENESGDLVKVYSDGIGIKISINKSLVKEIDKSEGFVEALIRSTADSFSKSYYQIKGILPMEGDGPENFVKHSGK